MLNNNINEIVENISKLQLQEIVILINELEKKFNISSDNFKNNNSNQVIEEKKEEQKTVFSFILKNIGKNKLSIIKLLRSKNSSLGLKEAKELVESFPVVLFDNISSDESKILEKEFLDLGAEIEIK